jgi:YHS domain-containing protein
MVSRLMFVVLFALAQAPAPAPVEALDGVDPVLLVGGKEVTGKTEYRVVRGAFEYWFASPESKMEFEKHPEKYEVQLGGLCARMGGSVRGNPSDFAVHDGRIYVFGSDECHKRFVAAPARYLEPPAAPFPSGEAIRAGREAIDRAVAAMGGAAVDSLSTLSETESHTEPRRMGEVTITTRTHWRFPDAIRVERDMPLPQGPMTFVTLLLPAGGWGMSQGRATPMLEAAAGNARVDLGRHPVVILRQRTAPGFAAAAHGPGNVAGLRLDQVRVRNGRIDVTLGLDPDSGVIRTLAYVDRGPQGEYGQFVVVYDDYRDVGGLKLPFARRTLFDGAPELSRSMRYSSIEVNAARDPRLFDVPAAR